MTQVRKKQVPNELCKQLVPQEEHTEYMGKMSLDSKKSGNIALNKGHLLLLC